MPCVDSSGAMMSGAARSVPRIIRPPPTAETSVHRVIARGAVRRGSFVSSDSAAALSNPYIT
jgi:hypothetical protein